MIDLLGDFSFINEMKSGGEEVVTLPGATLDRARDLEYFKEKFDEAYSRFNELNINNHVHAHSVNVTLTREVISDLSPCFGIDVEVELLGELEQEMLKIGFITHYTKLNDII